MAPRIPITLVALCLALAACHDRKEQHSATHDAETTSPEAPATPSPAPAAASTAAAQPPAHPTATATKEQPFVNSLDMKFVPVPITLGSAQADRVLFSVWETRRRDYAAYAALQSSVDRAWNRVEYKGQPVAQGDDEPVVNVSWDDAAAFCKWLTATERMSGRIPVAAEYRLPSDAEWSWAVGIGQQEQQAANKTPQGKDMKIKDVYPWGAVWPPTDRAGNYADSTAKSLFGDGLTGYVENFADGQATTGPVGSFEANPLGLYDLGGNVWEWCDDKYQASESWRVLRGGAWSSHDRAFLLSSARNYVLPAFRGANDCGFRCVLAIAPVKQGEPGFQ